MIGLAAPQMHDVLAHAAALLCLAAVALLPGHAIERAWLRGADLDGLRSLARAVLFSALTTGTAFAALALSAHPGTASMGVLLIIALFWILATTLIFLPALLFVATRRAPAEPA